MEKIVQGWFIETMRGETFRLLITNGHYPSIWKAFDSYKGKYYLIRTTDLIGREKDIICSLTEENVVTIKTKSDVTNKIESFEIINKNGKNVFKSNDIRIMMKIDYEI